MRDCDRKTGEYLATEGRWFVRNYKLNGVYKRKGTMKAERRAVVVMERHLGHFIPNDYCVHHKDGDITNDDLSNLQLMTKTEHSYITHIKNAVLNREKILLIRKLAKDGWTAREIKNSIGPDITAKTVRHIIKGKHWSKVA